MTESRDVAQRVRAARDLLSPSAEQRARVLAGVRARAVQSDGSTPSEPGPGARVGSVKRRSGASGVSKAGAWLAVGFAFGYWVAETRHAQDETRHAHEESAPAFAASGASEESSPGPTASPFAQSMPRSTPAQATGEPSSLPGAARVAAGVAAAGVAAAGVAAAGVAADAGTLEPAPPGRRTESGPRSRRKPAGPDQRSTARERRPRAAFDAASSKRRSRQPSGAEVSATAAEELALLQRAERAIRAGNGALARSFIADLELRFPRTIWREERKAILVLAACALEEPDAESAAREFIRRQAESVYIDRVQAFCGVEAPPASAPGSRVEDSSVSNTARVPDGSRAPGH